MTYIWDPPGVTVTWANDDLHTVEFILAHDSLIACLIDTLETPFWAKEERGGSLIVLEYALAEAGYVRMGARPTTEADLARARAILEML